MKFGTNTRLLLGLQQLIFVSFPWFTCTGLVLIVSVLCQRQNKTKLNKDRILFSVYKYILEGKGSLRQGELIFPKHSCGLMHQWVQYLKGVYMIPVFEKDDNYQSNAYWVINNMLFYKILYNIMITYWVQTTVMNMKKVSLLYMTHHNSVSFCVKGSCHTCETTLLVR